MPQPTDFLGRPIKVGDLIIYPVRRRSSMSLKKLRVDSVQGTPRGRCVRGTNDTGRSITIYNLHNCVVVENT